MILIICGYPYSELSMADTNCGGLLASSLPQEREPAGGAVQGLNRNRSYLCRMPARFGW